MSSPRKRKFRKADKTGRSVGGSKFVMLHHWVMDSDAFQSLRPHERAAYVELRRGFNGSNNGEIIMSVRQLASAINCSKDRAAEALQDLMNRGFIKCRQRGSFNQKLPYASKWILTEETYRGETASKEFARWRKESAGPERRTAGPESGTPVLKSGPRNGVTVPNSGPDRRNEQCSRSQKKDTCNIP